MLIGLTVFLGRAIECSTTPKRMRRPPERFAELERQGQRIGEYDTLIAGQAFCRNLVLVTANTHEFGKVKGSRSRTGQYERGGM